ncbi:hypothetical protein [Actinoallomurus sp. NPDC050550]|uniref:hypothetical protein n=1 Tax=Actinoallomurus sp. NPDC050550 TaxID=3154937 RepID=UPI003405FBFB
MSDNVITNKLDDGSSVITCEDADTADGSVHVDGELTTFFEKVADGQVRAISIPNGGTATFEEVGSRVCVAEDGTAFVKKVANGGVVRVFGTAIVEEVGKGGLVYVDGYAIVKKVTDGGFVRFVNGGNGIVEEVRDAGHVIDRGRDVIVQTVTDGGVVGVYNTAIVDEVGKGGQVWAAERGNPLVKKVADGGFLDIYMTATATVVEVGDGGTVRGTIIRS